MLDYSMGFLEAGIVDGRCPVNEFCTIGDMVDVSDWLDDEWDDL
jgi:hypothetical protein